MAGSKSDYLATQVLDHWLGKPAGSSSSGPATVYVALYNSTINDASDATSDAECSGSTYARVAVTNSSANWTNATSTNAAKENKTVVEFTTAAGSDWGTVVAFAILDSNSTSSGNILYWGDLSSSQAISSGNVVRFSTGAIDITEE